MAIFRFDPKAGRKPFISLSSSHSTFLPDRIEMCMGRTFGIPKLGIS